MKWVSVRTAIACQERLVGQYGGIVGLKSEGALESAMHRAVNLHSYGTTDLGTLAAAYGFGIAKNHPFHDANKRTALEVTELFLEMNGRTLLAKDGACVEGFLSMASGKSTEEEFVEWVHKNSGVHPPLPLKNAFRFDSN